jgi:hypothetical protein
VSSLLPGDERLHHSDGSHRWSGGPTSPREREAFLAALREHMERHRQPPASRARKQTPPQPQR